LSESQYEYNIERRIVTGLITSTQFLQQLEEIFQSNYLQSKTAKLISSWCWRYYKKYEKAPGEHIQDIYFAETDKLDKETAEWIEDVLEDLSDDFDPEQFNISYLYDETEKYFKQRALIELSETIIQQAEQGDLLEAELSVASFSLPEKITGSAIHPLDAEPDKYRRAFESVSSPLITFPGDLGSFINDQLVQGGFVGFVGPDKVGKTFFMLELAMRAVMQGSNVALFEVGDMTEEDMLCRIGIYLTKRSDIPYYCQELYYPVLDCKHNQLGQCKRIVQNPNAVFVEADFDEIWAKEFEEYKPLIQEESNYRHCHWGSTHPEQNQPPGFRGALWYKKREAVSLLVWQDAVKAVEKFKKRYRRELDLFVYPSGMLRPKDIRNELDILNKKKGYMPRVVLVDYPDVMEADDHRRDRRDKVNQIWQAGRRLSQEYQCLVVYATQSDSGGYSKKLLDRTNFSEDKRKNAHVTAMLGMNQTDEERVKGVLRLNKIVIRRGHFDSRKVCTVLQRLEMGRPFLGSFF